MRALLQALAELRAGNTSMRNLVVPLAQEAKRKNILPKHLLSPDEETWVFAYSIKGLYIKIYLHLYSMLC